MSQHKRFNKWERREKDVRMMKSYIWKNLPEVLFQAIDRQILYGNDRDEYVFLHPKTYFEWKEKGII